MLEFLIRIVGSLLVFKVEQKVVDYLLEPSQYEKNVERLKQEEWFSVLMADYRYEHIIRYNREVKQLLEDPQHVERLADNGEERKKFVAYIHREYAKLPR